MRTYWRRFNDDPDTTQELTEAQYDAEVDLDGPYNPTGWAYWAEDE